MAFEPQRLVFQNLCANLALNHVLNAIPMREACGAAAGTVIIPIVDPRVPQNFGAFTSSRRRPTATPSRSCGWTISHPALRLLKVDVEGMELEVLQGRGEMIATAARFLYVENDRKEKSPELIRYIASLGYEMYWHHPPLFKPEQLLRQQGERLRRRGVAEMLCVDRGEKSSGSRRSKSRRRCRNDHFNWATVFAASSAASALRLDVADVGRADRRLPAPRKPDAPLGADAFPCKLLELRLDLLRERELVLEELLLLRGRELFR
jgi:FkbM family methyltransferase